MSETQTQQDTTEAPTLDAAAHDSRDSAEGEAPERELKSAKPELPEDEMSFAEMFALAEKQSKEKQKAGERVQRGGIRPGLIVEARVIKVGADDIFVDLGGKAEGVMSKADLTEEEGEITDGSMIEARVISVEAGLVKLGRAIGADSAKNREQVKAAYQSGLPIEGRVTGQNKGGFEVEVGGLRAFCPISQMDNRFTNDPTQFLHQKYPFKVVEYKENGRNVVVSRRALLEEERKKKEAELLERLSVGKVVIGKITTLKDYGAFVDIGGVEGLVHVSEITHGRINKPSDVLRVGQEMDVQILKIEDDKKGHGKKISLSLKALARDPWDVARDALREGMKVSGKVLRIQPFGAFVEVMPGVDGLIHVSNMSNDRIGNPRDVLKEGEEVEATIVALEWEKRRIGLSLVKTRQELAGELATGKVYEAEVDKIESFGVFMKLASGARGLVPLSETGTQRGTDISKEFQIGQKMKVAVLDAERKSGKIRLSIKQASEVEERALYSQFIDKAPPGKGLGTLGDLLKKKK